MGKGDIKTYRGKLFNHSYGNKRLRKTKKSKKQLGSLYKTKQLSSLGKINYDKGKIGEDLVNELAIKSYLKYWCYPNPMDIDGDKKEICDLLVLFFDTAILISVKNYHLKGIYSRFKTKVIEKSTNQLFGAERKLFQNNKKIKLSHPDKGDEIFNPEIFRNIFRITVNVGEDFENYEFIDSKEGKGCINIFNKETFSTITMELDTIKDLVEYLKIRESLLLMNKDKTSSCKEIDLLASYLLNNREFPKFIYDDFEKGTLNVKGQWKVYNTDRDVIIKKLADEKSYFIDELIKNDVLKLPDGEQLAAELMTMSRFERRIIANNLFEIVAKYQENVDFFARRFMEYNGVGFLFIYYPIERPQKEINELIQYALQLYSYYKNTNKIVLLAASKNMMQWKFCLFQATEMSDEIETYLMNLANELGWFQNEQRLESTVEEFPN